MKRYVVFLRGINVGGHKIMKMDDLRQRFASLGFDNVSSYRASGNIIFESSKDPKDIKEEISKDLKELGGGVGVRLRSIPQILEILRLDPFKVSPESATNYVTFLSDEPTEKAILPLKSPKMDIEVILVRNLDVFCLAYKVNGSRGFPNSFVEKKFGVSATTRNWETVKGIAAANPD